MRKKDLVRGVDDDLSREQIKERERTRKKGRTRRERGGAVLGRCFHAILKIFSS